MRFNLAIGLAIGVGAFAPATFAQSTSGRGNDFTVGARLGYALPMGRLGTPFAMSGVNDALAEAVTAMFPVWVDLGYRLHPSVYLGGFFQYGPVLVNRQNVGCSADYSCWASDVAFGANVHYHLLPAADLDPWVGVGIGYEILSFGVSEGRPGFARDVSSAFTGLQFLNLQAGSDFKVSPDVAVGPFVSVAFGQFAGLSLTNNAIRQTERTDLDEKRMHEWLTIGARARFGL